MLKIPKSAAYLVLAVLFATAIYMVYIADGIGELLPSMSWQDQSTNLTPPQEEGDVEEDTLGDEPVDWDSEGQGQFFVEFRLERERVRSRELDTLQQLINNPNVSKEAKTEAENKLLALQEKMEMELLVENAIKAQGFKNAILILQEDGALVIVDAPELSSQQVLLIAQIASQATGLRASQINISAQGGK
jgi:stage III sporulation protein AH